MLEYHFPLQALDRFYFERIVGEMPVPLRGWAADLRVLRGGVTRQHINTLKDIYATRDYTFIPWLLDDIFDMPEDVRLNIGQGWVVLLIAEVMLDQSVDRQMPEAPVIPLIQQHLLLKAGEIFGRHFESPGPFWEEYHARLTQVVEALALESDCLDSHAQPYTYEMMRQVCAGKAAYFHIVVYALALASKSLHLLAHLRPVIDKLLLIDQLIDDALDWRKDYLAGRHTLPVLLAQNEARERHGNSVAGLSLDELDVLIEGHGILVYMAEQASFLVAEVMQSLREANMETTKLYTFFSERLGTAQRYRRHYQALRLVSGLARLLDTN